MRCTTLGPLVRAQIIWTERVEMQCQTQDRHFNQIKETLFMCNGSTLSAQTIGSPKQTVCTCAACTVKQPLQTTQPTQPSGNPSPPSCV